MTGIQTCALPIYLPPAFGTSEVSKGRTPRPPYLMTKSFALDGKREPNMGRTSLAGKVRKKNHATLQTAKGYLILISPADFHPEERVSPLGHEVEYSDKPELVPLRQSRFTKPNSSSKSSVNSSKSVSDILLNDSRCFGGFIIGYAPVSSMGHSLGFRGNQLYHRSQT